MLRIRLFFTISIFLCALYSSSAQNWESAAVECERIIYDGADLQETNSALVRKAECCKQLGRYADATAALARVRMFALSPEERHEVLYQQELCYFLSGEFSQAAAMVPEVDLDSADVLLLHALALAYSGNYPESEIYAARFISWDGESPHLGKLLKFYESAPRVRRPGTAFALSFVPPLGHLYNGAYGEGALSAGLNAAAVAFTVANLLGGYWVTGLLGGGMALNYTYMGNQQRNQALVEKHNHNDPIEFGDRLRALLLGFGEAED